MVMKSYPVIDMAATGANICRLRKAKGLSISDLQAYFGFDAPQAIYKWQQGKSLPSTDNLFALSHLLEVPIDKILIPVRPRFQVLPQEKSCGSGLFGRIISTISSLTIVLWFFIILSGSIIYNNQFFTVSYKSLLPASEWRIHQCLKNYRHFLSNVLPKGILWPDSHISMIKPPVCSICRGARSVQRMLPSYRDLEH